MDAYQIVTANITKRIEEGSLPWRRPWKDGLYSAVSFTTGEPYTSLNQMLIGRGGEFLTYNQAKALGGSVRKGARTHMVVYYKLSTYREFFKGEGWKMVPKDTSYVTLRYFKVFHIGDCDGIEARGNDSLSPCAADILSQYYAREGRPLPQGDDFWSLREAVLSTAEALGREPEGEGEFSKESLVADIGACMLLNLCRRDAPESEHCREWAEAINTDKHFIVSAAARADRAVGYILTGERPPVLF